MIKFTTKQVLKIYEQIIAETGGEYGVRDEKLLDSALMSPFQSFDNTDLFPLIQAKATTFCTLFLIYIQIYYRAKQSFFNYLHADNFYFLRADN